MTRFNYFIYFMFIVSIVGCGKKMIIVNYDNPDISYQGRIDTTTTEAALLYWSGTTMKINFEGESISALFEDSSADNYYNIIVDNSDSIFILKPDTAKKYYLLASNLPKGKHTIEIFKRTEWDRGMSTFYGFKIEGKAELLPKDPPFSRKIEFYGNSITAGYGVEDYSGRDRPDSIYTNNYLSYARLTADHFNAEYSCICKSGIGILVSWFPQIMPEIYDRIDPNNPESKWDFSLYTPDIVVVNLFQNDSWIVEMPDYVEFKRVFDKTKPDEEKIINSYASFIKSIRKEYPQANIICALGNMDITKEGSPWPGYVQKAVDKLGDEKIFTHFIPFKETPGHPKVEEQEVMAKSLIEFISTQFGW